MKDSARIFRTSSQNKTKTQFLFFLLHLATDPIKFTHVPFFSSIGLYSQYIHLFISFTQLTYSERDIYTHTYVHMCIYQYICIHVCIYLTMCVCVYLSPTLSLEGSRSKPITPVTGYRIPSLLYTMTSILQYIMTSMSCIMGVSSVIRVLMCL